MDIYALQLRGHFCPSGPGALPSCALLFVVKGCEFSINAFVRIDSSDDQKRVSSDLRIVKIICSNGYVFVYQSLMEPNWCLKSILHEEVWSILHLYMVVMECMVVH